MVFVDNKIYNYIVDWKKKSCTKDVSVLLNDTNKTIVLITSNKKRLCGINNNFLYEFQDYLGSSCKWLGWKAKVVQCNYVIGDCKIDSSINRENYESASTLFDNYDI